MNILRESKQKSSAAEKKCRQHTNLYEVWLECNKQREQILPYWGYDFILKVCINIEPKQRIKAGTKYRFGYYHHWAQISHFFILSMEAIEESRALGIHKKSFHLLILDSSLISVFLCFNPRLSVLDHILLTRSRGHFGFLKHFWINPRYYFKATFQLQRQI